jgi:hypothetical protein
VNKIIIVENKVPLDFILPKNLTVKDRKVYEEKIRQGYPWDHPSMPGRQRKVKSEELFVIPKREIVSSWNDYDSPGHKVEMKEQDEEIKQALAELSKIDYTLYPRELVRGIKESLSMSRNVIKSLKLTIPIKVEIKKR